MNLYLFVGNEAANQIDYLGLWHAATHKDLTSKSFDEAIKRNPNWSKKCTDKVKSSIIAHNLAQDKGQAFEDLKRHFNRKITDEPDKVETAINAKKDYKDYLDSEMENFFNAVAHIDPNSTQRYPAGCSLGIAAIGRLTHSWQDYYAHAVAFRPGRGLRATNKLWTANPPIAGNPDNMNPRIAPSSWDNIWSRGEHGALEPGGEEGRRRQEAAVDFVTDKLDPLLSYWIEKCICECDSIGY